MRRHNGRLIPSQNRGSLAKEGIQPEPDRSEKKPPRLMSGLAKSLQRMMELLQELIRSLDVRLVSGQ
ncbi:hypothetical protein CCMA1212_005456 [Trichoderma ghanense]|uniref:Uncharacterized protein n=1 Tax=Trichoderma ghanense TaxID=65468 RepID=A0ABY2H6B4_9HYPO